MTESVPDYLPLGTPTAQKLTLILAMWDILAFQDLVEKSGYSKTQVHSTLKELMSAGFITNPNRGIYQFSDAVFARHLKQAYIERTRVFLSAKLDDISKMVKTDPKKAQLVIDDLIAQYEPILMNSFRLLISSLSNQLLEYGL